MHAGGNDYRIGSNPNQIHRHQGQQQRFGGQQPNDPQADQALSQYFTLKTGQDGQSAGSFA